VGAIRLFLALVVAANHFMNETIWPSGGVISMRVLLGFNAGYAVLFFYVISGFLITYTLSENYRPTADGVAAFYRNRFIRIFSLYWPLLAFVVVAGEWPHEIGDVLTNVFLIGADWRVMFARFPAEHWEALPTHLHQAWTLAPELCFYLAAPWLLRSWKAAATLLGLSFALRFALLAVPGLDPRWTYLFAPPTFGFFMLGHLVCRAARHWPQLADRRAGGALLAICFATLALTRPTVAFDTPRLWVAILAFTAALPGLFAATKDARLLNTLGALSYPLYLTHELTRAYGERHLVASIPLDHPIMLLAAYCAVCVLIAVAVHFLIEGPLAALARTTTKRVINGSSMPRGSPAE
jgi:peptidoglycan/LPS O-acetylase OafA/YrhL